MKKLYYVVSKLSLLKKKTYVFFINMTYSKKDISYENEWFLHQARIFFQITFRKIKNISI